MENQSVANIELSKQLSVLAHGTTFLTSSAYGIYHFLHHNELIGYLLALLSINVLMSTVQILRNRDNQNYKYVFVAIMIVVLVITSHDFGVRGLILVFPVTAGIWFLLEPRQALVCNSLLISGSLVASAALMDTATSFRFAIALLLSMMFSGAFSYAVYQQRKALEKDANEDYLTGIMNRRSFNFWLDSILSRNTVKEKVLTLFYIDIDDFKYINDTYGHAAGDQILLEFSRRIISLIRHNEIVSQDNKTINFARLAGDEFVLAMLDIDDYEAAEIIAKRFIASMVSGFILPDAEIKLNISIGIALQSSEEQSAEELLRHADAAMYHAKNNGKNQYCFFNQKIFEELSESKEIEICIRKALEQDEFNLVFMPIYDCKNLDMVGTEVLLRSTSEKLQSVGADKYIPIAESYGLIREIDLWVIENTFRHINTVMQDPELGNIWFAINISALELYNQEFPGKLEKLLLQYDIPPERIELEVTETSLVSQDEVSLATLKNLKKLGVSLSLDDFGTGYTAFNQLMHYPVDNLKLDRTFVSSITTQDSNHASMVDIVISIANTYNLRVVAEGVETEEQLEYLKGLNCDFVQGYLLSRPIDWNSFLTLARNSVFKIKKVS